MYIAAFNAATRDVVDGLICLRLLSSMSRHVMLKCLVVLFSYC